MTFSKKGFFFTVLALILLTFMMVSVQMWAQEQQLREIRASERFRVDALKNAISLTDEASLAAFTNASLLYSLHFLSTSLANSVCAVPFIKDDKGGGKYPDGTYYVARSLAELMENGTTHGGPPSAPYPFDCPPARIGNITYSSSEMDYTLKSYFAKTSQAARLTGYNLTWGPVKNLTVNQTQVFGVTVKFSVDANISDLSGNFRQPMHYDIVAQTDINGLLDPFITASDHFHRGVPMAVAAHRQVFHVGSYASRGDASMEVAAGGSEGLGWFFGPLADLPHDNAAWQFTSTSYNKSRMKYYIFVTNDRDSAIAESIYFGGIILVSSSSGQVKIGSRGNGVTCLIKKYTQPNCVYCKIWEEYAIGGPLQCGSLLMTPTINSSTMLAKPIPYVNVPNNNWQSQLKNNYHLDLPEALINNKYNLTDALADVQKKFSSSQNDSSISDLTGPRDMAICGYYVPSKNGPSYLKRFTQPASWGSPPYSKFGGAELGIESVLLGSWAGGSTDPQNYNHLNDISWPSSEFFSRLDYLFYRPTFMYNNQCLGLFEKGMPGCKDADMCAPGSTGPAENATGRFAFDNETGAGYGFTWPYNVTPKSGQANACP